MTVTRDGWVEGELDISTTSIGLTDFSSDALAHVVTGAEFEHRRLQGGGAKIDLMQCFLPHSTINSGTYSPPVHVNGTFASNSITIGMMLHQTEPTIVNGSNIKVGSVQVYAEQSEICYRAWPNATWLAFVISRERLLQFFIDYFDEIPDLPKNGILTSEPTMKERGDQLVECLRDLDRSFRSICSRGPLQHEGRLGESIEHDVLVRIGNVLSAKRLAQRTCDRRQLRLCGELLRDTMKLVEQDPSEMLDLRSMSKATGLNPRTLQRTFQREYGLCPQEWLRVERLHRVRQDLLSAQTVASVTHTATRWGFFHLGRFSQYYRELFGELANQTVSRRCAMLHDNHS